MATTDSPSPTAHPDQQNFPDSPDLHDLQAQLDGSLSTDPDVLASFSTDESVYRPEGAALALVRATSVDDVVHTMRFAHTHGIPVVPQGRVPGWPVEHARSPGRSCCRCVPWTASSRSTPTP